MVAPPRESLAGPALAMLDIALVPPGLRALDALVKEAPVDVLGSGTVQPGHYLIVFGGEVEPVERSLRRAEEVAGSFVRDTVLLADAEPRIVPALLAHARRGAAGGDTVAVVQTAAPPTLLRAVDAALKGAAVELAELRVGDGLGGQALASLWGELADVEAAVSLANAAIARGYADGASTTIIPRADAQVLRAIQGGTQFFREGRG